MALYTFKRSASAAGDDFNSYLSDENEFYATDNDLSNAGEWEQRSTVGVEAGGLDSSSKSWSALLGRNQNTCDGGVDQERSALSVSTSINLNKGNFSDVSNSMPQGSVPCHASMVINTSNQSPSNRTMRSRSGTVSTTRCSMSASTRFVCDSFVVVKGAAVILPSSSDARPLCAVDRPCPEIQSHLMAIFTVLKHCDTIRAAVRLESRSADCIKYVAVVYRNGAVDLEESIVLGVDILPPSGNESSTLRPRALVGVVLPLYADAKIKLDGDGGFSVSSNDRCHVFKPVSVLAMWSVLHTLDRAVRIACTNVFHPAGLSHTWIASYEALVADNDSLRVVEWNRLDDVETTPGVNGRSAADSGNTGDEIYQSIRTKLREVMLTVDLEEVNTKYLRERLETELSMDLNEYRKLIDEEAIVIMGQLEKPSEIFEYLFLGSEWNAANFDELRVNGVTHIVNVSREVDCFFPSTFRYFPVRVYDTADADLLIFWDRTFRFIDEARRSGGRVLVHCKMGVSRSASTVVAYCMKQYGWSLSEAFSYVKRRRACIKPNDNFMRQLAVYGGIVEASRQRHNPLFSFRSDLRLREEESDAKQWPLTTFKRTRSLRADSRLFENPDIDIGVKTHYERENIPWKPGSVKLHSVSLEQRAQSRFGIPVHRSQVTQQENEEADSTVKPGTVRNLVRAFGSEPQAQSSVGSLVRGQARETLVSDVRNDAFDHETQYHSVNRERKLSYRSERERSSATVSRPRTAAVSDGVYSRFSRNSVVYITL